MIVNYLVTREGEDTLVSLLRDWAPELRNHLRILRYEDLFTAKTVPKGPYIFSDIERLGPVAAERMAQVWKQLDGERLHLLNHPTRSLRRYELMRVLHERGINRFNVFRLTEGRMPTRYPVFIRFENDHNGSRSPLLGSEADLRRTIDVFMDKGVSRERILICEFLDTSGGTGLYRKYSYLKLGSAILPRHLLFSRHHIVKLPDLDDDDLLAEEVAFVEAMPYRDESAKIFEIAGIDYGRIDFSVDDGRIQVWEINTNPMIFTPPEPGDKRIPLGRRFAQAYAHAMIAVASSSGRADDGKAAG